MSIWRRLWESVRPPSTWGRATRNWERAEPVDADLTPPVAHSGKSRSLLPMLDVLSGTPGVETLTMKLNEPMTVVFNDRVPQEFIDLSRKVGGMEVVISPILPPGTAYLMPEALANVVRQYQHSETPKYLRDVRLDDVHDLLGPDADAVDRAVKDYLRRHGIDSPRSITKITGIQP